MANDVNEKLTLLVKKGFASRREDDLIAVKQFCLEHFGHHMALLKEKITSSNTSFYEKEILVVTDEIEAMISAWCPGNRCFPHDHDMAECFVFVLRGRVTNRTLKLVAGELKVISKETRECGEHLYLYKGIIHYMENTGDEQLICLHIYQPGISEMKVYDDASKTVYTLKGEAGAWLPPMEDHVLTVKSYLSESISK